MQSFKTVKTKKTRSTLNDLFLHVNTVSVIWAEKVNENLVSVFCDLFPRLSVYILQNIIDTIFLSLCFIILYSMCAKTEAHFCKITIFFKFNHSIFNFLK